MVEPAEELRRLRLDLYRPDPPAGTRERYEALLGAQPEGIGTSPDASPEPAPGPLTQEVLSTTAPPSPLRHRPAAGVVAALVAAGVVTIGLVETEQHGSAEPLGQGLTQRDDARLERALAPSDAAWGPASAGTTVVDVLRRSDLRQLAVWDRREALGWVQHGTGGLHREFGGGGTGRATAEPLSIVVRCARDASYDWAIRGTAPGSAVVHVLAQGDSDRCGPATVATATLPAGSRITAFDLRVPAGVGWTMAVVVPDAD